MGRKRERLEVIFDILKNVQDHQTIGPTRLLYASNLSPQMFKEYIEELLEKGLLEQIEDAKKEYRLSRKGYDLLEQYNVILRFIDNFGL